MSAPMPPSPRPVEPDARVARVVEFYETLAVATLSHIDSVYTDDARFIDPFNDVTGHAGIRRVFEHMFATLDTPTFEVIQSITEGDHGFLLWNFGFRRKGRSDSAVIHGASHLHFASDGRIAVHRDYWDPARELYEDLPLLGPVVRWLRRRLAAPAPGPGAGR
jgi:ketosteroid isomerase-like protein